MEPITDAQNPHLSKPVDTNGTTTDEEAIEIKNEVSPPASPRDSLPEWKWKLMLATIGLTAFFYGATARFHIYLAA